MNYTSAEIWFIFAVLGIGTFLIRYSFLGIIGNRPMPPWVLRHLRYTAVAILPGLVAPLVIWPAATDGNPEPTRLAAAAAAIIVGYLTKGVTRAMLAGAATFYALQYLLA